MDPAVLIFLLYVMIAHELVCGFMQRRRSRERASAPLLRSRGQACRRVWRLSSRPAGTSRAQRDLKKSGRFVRKA
ncbi:hypothetical protein FQA47_014227 [Oryzias melastigma]|uniref:Uncharacterized protein n=1 Tax=Oryzias melastigma TaxID=30732 RepID=A0A834EZL2_ORYME|nr:hypothetical protein FQA47_015608 [Oryzias melastigma]KAF6715716.1 hypothetical protein FQA47_014227 [Oryzias melastigma]